MNFMKTEKEMNEYLKTKSYPVVLDNANYEYPIMVEVIEESAYGTTLRVHTEANIKKMKLIVDEWEHLER